MKIDRSLTVDHYFVIDPPAGYRYGFPKMFLKTDVDDSQKLEKIFREAGIKDSDMSLSLNHLRVWTPDTIELAHAWAADAHRNQVRKYTGNPYIEHPRHLEKMAELWFGGTQLPLNFRKHVRIAALLHDTIEDCGVTEQEIEKVFGYQVSKAVASLTKVNDPNMKRREKNKAYCEQLRQACPIAIAVKAFDILSNTQDLVASGDRKFAKTYLEESEHKLMALRTAWYKHAYQNEAFGEEAKSSITRLLEWVQMQIYTLTRIVDALLTTSKKEQRNA